jgi:hypothetical protein
VAARAVGDSASRYTPLMSPVTADIRSQELVPVVKNLRGHEFVVLPPYEVYRALFAGAFTPDADSRGIPLRDTPSTHLSSLKVRLNLQASTCIIRRECPYAQFRMDRPCLPYLRDRCAVLERIINPEPTTVRALSSAKYCNQTHTSPRSFVVNCPA